MAKHRRHRRHRRGFGDLVSIPSVGALKDYNPLGKTVRSTDVIVGAGIGMAGGLAVKWGIGKLDEVSGGKVPQFVRDYIGPISTVAAGVAAFMFEHKRNHSRAQAHFIGAVLAAAVPAGWTILKNQFPALAGYVDVNYGNYGMLLDEGQMQGMLIDDGMHGLAAYSNADDMDILDAA